MISKKIKSMISGEGEKPFLVRDSESGDYRRLKYSDIAILFRAVSGRAEIFVDALISEGIPAYAQTSAGYFDTLEVRVVLAMLQAIDNPYSEVELAAFLHSPVVGLCDNELAEIIYRYKSRMYEKKHIMMPVYMHLISNLRVLIKILCIKLKRHLICFQDIRKCQDIPNCPNC